MSEATTEAAVPCPGCDATAYSLCMCRHADTVEADLDGTFAAGARILRRLGRDDARRLIRTLQYRAEIKGYDRGLTDGAAVGKGLRS